MWILGGGGTLLELSVGRLEFKNNEIMTDISVE